MSTPENGRTPAYRNTSLSLNRAETLLQKLRRRAATRKSMWGIHLAAFVSVNAFLAFIDFVTGGGKIWFLYPLGGWVIPFLVHYVHVKRRDRLQKKLEEHLAKPGGLPDRMFRPFRRLHRSTTHFLMTLSTAVSVSAYLFMINILTGGSFWAAIPAASMGLATLFHYMLFRSRRSAMLTQLAGGGDPRVREQRHTSIVDDAPAALESGGGAQEWSGEHPALGEARNLAATIRRLVAEGDSRQDELLANLDEMLCELERLCSLEREFAQAEQLISLAELEKDRDMVRELADRGDTGSRQYRATLTQLERQIESYRKLVHRHEVVQLRIRTSVNSLRQLNLDLVRIKGESALSEVDSLIQEKANELSSYLSDLQESYQELSNEF